MFGEQGSYLVDHYHLSEYFADAAEECVGINMEARVQWRHIQQERMKSGNISSVMAELDLHRNGKKGAIVQMRLKIPGAWWKPSNGGVMLCLRALRSNGDWDNYWKKAE